MPDIGTIVTWGAVLIGIVAGIVGIVAGIVQVKDYFQKQRRKRLSTTSSSPALLPRPPLMHGASKLARIGCVHSFFNTGKLSRVVIVMPPRPRPKLEGRMEYGNRPFQYDFAADDVFTLAAIMPILTELYGHDAVHIITPVDIGNLHFRPDIIISIGSPISNEISKAYLLDKRLPFTMAGYDIYRGTELGYKSEIQDQKMTVDYGLISKHTAQTKQIVLVLAGCHTFGQLAISFALSDLGFYKLLSERVDLHQFQIVLRADVHENWLSDYQLSEMVSLSLTPA